MIKVEEKSLYGNYNTGHGARNYSSNSHIMRTAAYVGGTPQPSFSGKGLTPIQKKFLALFPKKEANLYKFMEKASDFIKGEMGGIVITAVGTGLVAPFPIAFNPFVKAKPGATQEEKDEVKRTKAYSAWRQPISAVIALLIQAGVQKPIDRFLQNLTNDAETAAKWKGSVLNQTSLNDADYLKRKIKKEFKDGTLKFEDGKIFDVQSGNKEIGTAKDLKEAISAVQEMRTKSQLATIAKTLETEGVIRMGSFNIDKSVTAEVVNDCIDKYMEAIVDMKSKPAEIDFHTRRAEVLVKNEAELNRLIGKDALKDLRRFTDLVDGKEIERIEFRDLKNYIEGAKSRASNEDVKQILEEILHKPDAVMESRCERTIERIKTVKEACGGTFDADVYHMYLHKQNRILQKINDKLEILKIKDVSQSTPEQIKATIEKIPEVLYHDASDKELHRVLKRNSNLFISDAAEEMSNLKGNAGEISANLRKKIKGKVLDDVAKTYKEFTANKFKLFKQLTKVGVGVCITLPISCTVLNWVYPRFMDLFFPKLAGTKKDADAKKNGGAK